MTKYEQWVGNRAWQIADFVDNQIYSIKEILKTTDNVIYQSKYKLLPKYEILADIVLEKSKINELAELANSYSLKEINNEFLKFFKKNRGFKNGYK